MGYKQPEDYGYDFTGWISPYTKGAHRGNSIALVLQDWASDKKLLQGFNPSLQEHGRILELTTNRRLTEIIKAIFGVGIEDTYITNAFPFIKPGNMSSTIPAKDVLAAAKEFLIAELNIAQPKLILALGIQAGSVLSTLGVAHVSVPHPAARIGNTSAHINKWTGLLNEHNSLGAITQ
ncbi:MAG TPA: uracil-DNA glycosylase family protein [Cellvibrionaceae bacterium]